MLVTGLVAQGVATLWLAAPMWQGRRPMETWSAATYLPTVAQNFVAASAAMQFGWTDLAPLLFGAGLLSWLSLESVILLRAASHGEMPSAARPAQGIQMAPPFVAAMAWLSLNGGHVDLVAQMLFGYGWLQAALALRLMRWSSQAGLVLGYWAYSFGVMAMASTAIRIAAGGGYYLPPGMAQGVLLQAAAGEAAPGWKRLTEREWHVLRLIVKGVSLTGIGEELRLSVKTVSTYRGRVLAKLGLHSNAELVRYCLEHGLAE